MFKCEKCGNTNRFVTRYTITGECEVDQDGTLIAGITDGDRSKSIYVKYTQDYDIGKPMKCAECGEVVFNV